MADDAPEASPTPFEDAVRDAQTSTTLKKQLEELVEKANGLLEQSTKSSVETALEIYDSCLRTQPRGDVVVPLLVNRALALDALGSHAEAAESAELASRAAPNSDRAAELNELVAQFRAAAREKAARKPEGPAYDGDADAVVAAAQADAIAGRRPDAVARARAASTRRAIAADPSWPKGYLRLGHAMAAMGSALEAMEAFLNGAQVARVAARGGASSDCAALERAALACRERGNAQGRTLQSGAIARGLDVDEDRLHFERGAEDGGNGSVAGRHGLASCLLFKAWPTAALLGRPPRDVSVAGNKAAFDALARGWGVEAVDDRRSRTGPRTATRSTSSAGRRISRSTTSPRDLTVPFADRHAMCGELDRLLHGDDDDERLDAAPDADYVARRRGAAAVDLGDVDDRFGALTMNAFVFGPTGEAVCVPRLGALCNHAHDGNAELRPGPRRGEIAFVATRDIARGEAITLDYCPFSATTAHRDAVLRPFLLEHLARVPVVEDAPVAYPDEVAPLRRREPDFAPHP
ncbi:hypothetical protein JL721_5095 [Aureococcus anophagefferens]|nr:hypothetical protein JL721_5095 [Aureococcus anophagefferens]